MPKQPKPIEELVFDLPNPADIHRVTEGLSKQKVNIDGIFSTPAGNQTRVHLLPRDMTKAAKALEEADINFQKSRVIGVPLKNEPGELDRVVARLTKAGIECESCYVALTKDGPSVTLQVDNPSEAIQALKS